MIVGILLFATGIFALFPGLSNYPVEGLPALEVQNSYGLFLGFVTMNILNKIALIGFGLGGIWAATRPTTSLPASINYSRLLFVAMGALAILGLIPATQTLFGYWPLWGYNVWIYGFVALLGAYFGFALSSRVPKQPDVPKRTPLHN